MVLGSWQGWPWPQPRCSQARAPWQCPVPRGARCHSPPVGRQPSQNANKVYFLRDLGLLPPRPRLSGSPQRSASTLREPHRLRTCSCSFYSCGHKPTRACHADLALPAPALTTDPTGSLQLHSPTSRLHCPRGSAKALWGSGWTQTSRAPSSSWGTGATVPTAVPDLATQRGPGVAGLCSSGLGPSP